MVRLRTATFLAIPTMIQISNEEIFVVICNQSGGANAKNNKVEKFPSYEERQL